MSHDYDYFVIGAGSGGVRSARIAASLGARVAVAESRYLGGTCVNVGCVPKKLFVYASEFGELAEQAEGFGWHFTHSEMHWPKLIENKNAEIERLNSIYGNLLNNSGVTLINGRASIVDPHTITVDKQSFSAEKILVATGGWPRRPSYPGAELSISSNEFFFLHERPQRILIEGGGYVAVEFAGILNGLGCDVVQAYRKPMFLRGFDHELGPFLAAEMGKKGIDIRFETQIEGLQKVGDGIEATFSNDDSVTVDCVISAIGRVPLSSDLGLENTAVRCNEQGFIEVNETFQTAEPSIYAVGDVVGRMALTPVAIREGEQLARHLFSDNPITFSYHNIPTAVFSQPNIGTVGLSQEQAEGLGHSVRTFTSEFKALKHTLSGSSERTLMKLVVDSDNDRVLGCHMVGEHAGEIIQGMAIAVKMGAKKSDFDATVGVHPSSAEEFVTLR